MKKMRLVTLFLGGLALLLSLTALPMAAAGVDNTFPGGAMVIDNQTHSISANGSLWYRFDYAGDRSQIVLTLPNGNLNQLEFKVYTPAQVGDWWETAPIGRGTGQQINCDTGMPETSGACQADNLTWVGDFNESGTYYVQVVNPNSSALSFNLMIQGSGVSLAAQTTSTSSSGGTTGPSAAVPAPMANMDPGHASVIDNQAHTIAANGSLWYRFYYTGDKSEILLTLPNGNLNGLHFNVFTPGQVSDWWEVAAIGRGTGQEINCDTGMPETGGACQADDLTWKGDFNEYGTYYVQVVNPTANALSAQLMIQGDGVTLTP